MRLLCAALVLFGSSVAAHAACFEGIGCTDRNLFPRQQLRQLSCENLWYARNVIYSENGYCFRTERALRYFDNSGCFVTNESRLRLNRFERNNISRIRQVERNRGCP